MQAVARSKTLDEKEVGAIVSEIEGSGSLEAFFNNPKAINDLVKTLLDKGIIGRNDVAELLEANGNRLSPQGKEFVKNLLLGGIFKGDTIQMMGIDSALKNKVINGIRSIMQNMKLGEYSLREEVDNAVALIYEAKRAGMSVSDYLRQNNAFEENARDKYSQVEQALAQALDGSASLFRDLMAEYNKVASARNTGEENMFGEHQTKEELVKEFVEKCKTIKENDIKLFGNEEGHKDRENGSDAAGDEKPAGETGSGAAETQRQVDEAVKAVATEITEKTGVEVVTDEKAAEAAYEALGGKVKHQRSDEIDKKYPNWLEGTTNDNGKHSTQVAGTIGTYKKVAAWIEKNLGKKVRILDASSGMGLGTQELRKQGFNIEDVEPYQSDDRKKKNPATYSSYNDIEGDYDVIISNAVLNVIPDDWRSNVLHDMASRLKDDGKLFINTRKAGEEKSIKDKIELDSPQEVLVKRNGKIASYQRFFTPKELRDWVQKELGDGYEVEVANEKNSGTKGLAAVVVTKKASSVTVTPPDKNRDNVSAVRKNAYAKVQQELDTAKEYYGKAPNKTRGFLQDLTIALGLNQTGPSRYRTFVAEDGHEFTLRISNHNSVVSFFDKNGEEEGVSIIVSGLRNKHIRNDGSAHVKEFFYPKKTIERAQGKPLVEIIESLKETVKTGDFVDTTGLAIPEEVNIREFRTKDGEVYGFTDGEKIYLDTRKMKPETPLHEYAHLWVEGLKAKNPEEWENVKKLFDKVEGLKEEVQKLYPELKGDDLYEEMITTFSGRDGAKKLEQTVRELAAKEGKSVTESAKAQGFVDKVREGLQRFWQGVADMLHIHFTTAEEVADKVLADWAKGVDPRVKEENSKVQMTPGTKLSMDDLKNVFDSCNKKDEELGFLFGKVYAVAKDLGLNVSVYSDENTRTSAYYHGKGNVLRINSHFWNAIKIIDGKGNVIDMNDQKRAEVITHELIHSVTAYAEYWNKVDPSRLPEPLREAANELEALYDHVMAGAWYRLPSYCRESASEFVAEASNPEVRNVLKKMGVWTRFVNAVKKFFTYYTRRNAIASGLVDAEGFEQSSAYTELDKVIDKFLNNFDKESYDAYVAVASGREDMAEGARPEDLGLDRLNHKVELHSDERGNDELTDGKDRRQEELFLSLQNKKGKEYYDTVTEIAREISSPERANQSEGKEIQHEPLSRGDEGRLVQGERISREAGSGQENARLLPYAIRIIAEDKRRTYSDIEKGTRGKARSVDTGFVLPSIGNLGHNIQDKRVQHEVEDHVEEWARQNGVFISEEKVALESLDGKKYDDGDESNVYRLKDGKSVLKFTDYVIVHGGIGEYVDFVEDYNKLFPETHCEIVGVSRNSKEKFSLVVRQPFADGEKVTYESFVENGEKYKNLLESYFEKKGLVPLGDNTLSYFNKDYYVTDVHRGNYVVKDGKPVVFDADVKKTSGLNKDERAVLDNAIRDWKETLALIEDDIKNMSEDNADINELRTLAEKIRSDINKASQSNTPHYRVATAADGASRSDSVSVVENHVEKVSKKLGTKVNVVNSIDEVSDPRVKADIEAGKNVTGWYDEKAGEVHLYMPNVKDTYTAEVLMELSLQNV